MGITVTGVVNYLFIVGPKLDEVLPSLYGVWLFTPVKISAYVDLWLAVHDAK